jgi:Protein of unknown function (DUF2842)
MRIRILVGALILVFGLTVYAIAIASLARAVLPDDIIVQILFYAGAGIAWLAPTARLTRWMQRAAPYRPPGVLS